MKLQIQSTRTHADAALLDVIHRKINKLERFYDHIETCHIVLKKEKDEHKKAFRVKVRLAVPGEDIFASDVSHSFEKAIKAVIQELKKQLIRRREKMIEKDASRHQKRKMNFTEPDTELAPNQNDLNRPIDNKIKGDFPGYPYYPSEEDIMDPRNRHQKNEFAEGDELTRGLNMDQSSVKDISDEIIMEAENDDDEFAETNITADERIFLESDQLSEDMGEDEELRSRVWSVDMSGDDLDIPGTELDDAEEEIGKEDEENNSYSIGGDRHEGMEEIHDQGR